MDAQLAKIESRNESDFIASLLNSNSSSGFHWIGLTYIEFENHWKWSDGSSLGPFDPWKPGKPDNSSLEKGCVGLHRVWWHDRSCFVKHKLICEENKTEVA